MRECARVRILASIQSRRHALQSTNTLHRAEKQPLLCHNQVPAPSLQVRRHLLGERCHHEWPLACTSLWRYRCRCLPMLRCQGMQDSIRSYHILVACPIRCCAEAGIKERCYRQCGIPATSRNRSVKTTSILSETHRTTLICPVDLLRCFGGIDNCNSLNRDLVAEAFSFAIYHV